MSSATRDVLDSLDMFGHAARFPEQVAEAARKYLNPDKLAIATAGS